MNARVAFKSASFPKYQDEDAETINAHLWGKRLAEYLRNQLPNHGVATAGILCEDFGWIVEIEHEPFPLFIGCGVIDDEDDCDDANEADDAGGGGKTEIEPTPPGPVAADGPAALNAFAIFVAAEPGFFKYLFKKVDTQPAIAKLVTALKALMSGNDHFQDVVWDD